MKELYVPTLREIIDNSAAKYGSKTFIKYLKDDEIVEKSYSEVRRDAIAVCRYLRKFTTEKQHIAVLGKTSYEHIIFMLGVILSGNVLVPLAPEISADEAAMLVKDADVNVFLYGNVFKDRAADLKRQCPHLFPFMNYDDDIIMALVADKFSDESEFASLSEFEVDKDECCTIVYTSGTTGRKKGVMLSTNSLIGNIMYTDKWDVLTEGRSTLSVLPMHHLYCFSGDVIRNLRDGVTLCLNGEIRDLQKNILRFQPYVMRIVPLIAQSLLQRFRVVSSKNPGLTTSQAAELVFGKHLRQIISGAAYLKPSLVAEYAKLGIKLIQGYGMTEAGCRIAVPDTAAPVGAVGRVIDICDVRTSAGEIQVRTPSVMLGYYKMPEKTAEMFTEDGWLRTGDIGEVDENGFLFISGRLKNLIILSGGENVSPEAIEKKFANYEPVAEILVRAENDRLVADVFPDYDYCRMSGIDDIEKTIRDKVNEMNITAKPSHIISEVNIYENPLPKTATGKLKRRYNI